MRRALPLCCQFAHIRTPHPNSPACLWTAKLRPRKSPTPGLDGDLRCLGQSRPGLWQYLRSVSSEANIMPCSIIGSRLFRRSGPGMRDTSARRDLHFPGRMIDQPDRPMLDGGPAAFAALLCLQGSTREAVPAAATLSNRCKTVFRDSDRSNLKWSFHLPARQWRWSRFESMPYKLPIPGRLLAQPEIERV